MRAEHVVGSRTTRIWVEDNGIGVPPEFRDRIFEMFERATKDYEGTGIGLAIVRKVVLKMGGKVGVESTSGQGSRFWVELQTPDEQNPPLKPATGDDAAST